MAESRAERLARLQEEVASGFNPLREDLEWLLDQVDPNEQPRWSRWDPR